MNNRLTPAQVALSYTASLVAGRLVSLSPTNPAKDTKSPAGIAWASMIALVCDPASVNERQESDRLFDALMATADYSIDAMCDREAEAAVNGRFALAALIAQEVAFRFSAPASSEVL